MFFLIWRKISTFAAKVRNMNETKVKILSIGDELLIGQVINTNASWLGKRLTEAGYHVDSVLTIGDGEEAILNAFQDALEADLVLVTGGLGPTADDITKPTVCKFFDTELVFSQEVYDNIVAIFARRGFQMSERNKTQAFIPKSCIYVPNRYGTAPCMWLEKEGTVFVFMPGVPFEMKGIFNEELLPRFEQRFKAKPYAQRVIMTTGVGESFLADRIQDWEKNLPDFMSLAYLPQYGIVRLRLSGRHEDASFLKNSLDHEVTQLMNLISDCVFALDDKPIENVVFELLLNKGLTFATAESCTGGNMAHRITLIPGSSEVFKGTAVTYATEMKTAMIGVPETLIAEHGVVSREVAEHMALGMRKLSGADFALSSTGIAGPSGGSDENPVGTVWLALATPTGVVSQRYNFGKDRENVIERATVTAYAMLLRYLKEQDKSQV